MDHPLIDQPTLTPFHQSVIIALNLMEQEMLEQPRYQEAQEEFIQRYYNRALPLLHLISITVIPKDHLSKFTENLQIFHRGFDERYRQIVLNTTLRGVLKYKEDFDSFMNLLLMHLLDRAKPE